MKDKPLWRTKTFWLGVAGVASGIGLCFSGSIPEGVQTIIGGFALITARDAYRKGQKR